MKYYVPKAQTVTLPSGKKMRLNRGVSDDLPVELVDSPLANTLGIKPVEEMTDLERRMIGLKPKA